MKSSLVTFLIKFSILLKVQKKDSNKELVSLDSIKNISMYSCSKTILY